MLTRLILSVYPEVLSGAASADLLKGESSPVRGLRQVLVLMGLGDL